MSGVQLIGIISGIITIVDATLKVYDAANDSSGLPEAFRDVAKRLPLVLETLKTTQSYLDTNPDAALCIAMKPILEDCANKAGRLAAIFEKVIPRANTSRLERYMLAAQTLAKGDTVESLMKGVLVDVQLLADSRVTKMPTASEITHLIQVAIENLSAIPPSLPGQESPSSDADRNALIKKLRWIDPTLDRDRIERTKGGLDEEASRWILAHPSYHQWRYGANNLLWIKGGAGKGKTMLLVAITKVLQPLTKLSRQSANSLLTFFFCQNTDDRLNNAVAILKGLLYLLLIQDNSLVSYLQDYYDRMSKDVFDAANNVNAFDALSSVFRQMVAHPRSETIYLAVDALDECEHDLSGLLSLIGETCHQSYHLKWIVTSRNHVNVDKSLALSLEVNSAAVLRAINIYIEHKISQVPSLKSNKIQRAHIRQKLVEKADGTFLWVDLVLRSIGDALSDDITRLIDEVPKGLPALYDVMMRNIGVSAMANQLPCLVTLAITTLTYRPLHLFELRMLAGLERFDTSDIEKIVDMCGSFLILQDNYVYHIHQSVKDYLVSEAAVGKIFPSGTGSVHRSIVEKSVAEMSKVLKRDIYGLVHPGTLIHEVIVPPEKDPLTGMGYSCAYWIDHACEADDIKFQKSQDFWLLKMFKQHLAPSRKTDRFRNLIVQFLHVHFLHWLEALSLLGVVTNGVFSLTQLRDTQIVRDKSFVNLVEDMYRFILRNRSIVERAPLQTYVSALIFTPVNSITRRMFKAEEPNWVITKPIIEEFWSKCLQACEGHRDRVNSVSFSQDGSRIASGSSDMTIRIWDAKSGKELSKLEGHIHWIYSVAFSQDGNLIASGSQDGTVRIWDANLGKEICTLKGHAGRVTSVAFSHDGSYIASGSYDTTVRVWDIVSGKEVHKLECYKKGVNSVAFSKDGSCIASGSSNRVVYIWDIKSGKEVRRLEGHGGRINSVAFSHDGNRVVSGSIDRTIRIWDAKSGKEMRKFEGHKSGVNSVTLSQDGTRIASGSDDTSIRIWDVKSGKEVRRLDGHGLVVNSIRFSQDGSRVASGSNDRTVRIWDARPSKEVRKLEHHGGWFNSIAFSQDGSCVVSGSDDSTVRIWDAKSGKELRKLEGHGDRVTSVAFSRDGNRIASSSQDGTVRIWDTKSGKQLRTIHMSHSVFRLRFETSNDTGLVLQTNIGTILAGLSNSHSDGRRVHGRTSLMVETRDQLSSDQQSSSEETRADWSLNNEGSWITWRGRGTVWLPHDFRSSLSDVSSDGSAIAIGCRTGRLMIMRMSLIGPFPQGRS